MAPRAYWKGYLKLSLVSCPIALYPATSEREKISFHQLNKNTGHRIKYRKVDADTGDEVESTDIIKGYQVGKGEYLELDPEELEAIAIESKRTIEIDEFVPRKEIDELYLNSPYYIVPDGEVGQQAFAEEHIQACSTFIADIVPIVCDGCVQHRKPHCALSNGILLLPVFKPSLKFFRDPIVGVRLVLKASDLFEVPVGPGGRNAPILAFGAPDLQDWDGRHGRPPQVQTASNRILVRINGHKCTEFRDENAAPLSVPAIRENCRRAEKRSADATRVKDGA